MQDRSSKPSRLARIVPWLFTLAVFGTATFWLRGDLGKWADDYGFHQRDPVTGSYEWSRFVGSAWGYFWRPLHIRWSTFLQTVFWHHDWVNHTVNVLGHALVCFMLWRVLRAMTRSPHAAMLGAGLFAVAPSGYEVVFWPSTASTSWGSALMLVVWLWLVRLAQGRARTRIIVPMLVVSFLVPCWYEQPAAALAAMPLAYLACCRPEESWVRRLWRAALFPGLCCLMPALYIVLYALTAPPNARGGAGSIIGSADLAEKISLVSRQTVQHFWNAKLFTGAVAEGWRRLNDPPWLGPAWLGLLAVLAWPFLAHWSSRPVEEPQGSSTGSGAPVPAPRPLLVAAAGVAVILLASLPAIVVRDQWVAPRMLYVPLIGLAMIIAAGVDAVLRWAAGRPAERRLAGGVAAAFVALAIPFMAVMVGIQAVYQARWRMDQRECEQLTALVAAPPPDALFIPFRVDSRPLDTGHGFYDGSRTGVFEMAWSIQYVKHLYARKDVYGIAHNRWASQQFRDFSETSFRFTGGNWIGDKYRFAPGEKSAVLPWEPVVGFTIDREGTVRLIDRVRILRDDNRDFTVPLPAIRTLRPAPPPRLVQSFTLREISPLAGLKPIEGWRWEAGKRLVEFKPTGSWGITYAAAAMHPPTPSGGGKDDMRVSLPRSDAARKVHIRASMIDWAVLPADGSGPRGDGARVIVSLDGAPGGAGTTLADITLRPQAEEPHRTWMPITVDVPPSDKRVWLRVRVEPGERSDPSYDSVLITSGFLEDAADAE